MTAPISRYICQLGPIRERAHLTQAELARRAGANRQAVNLIERGKVVPSVTTALALAEALGCTVADIFPATPGAGSHLEATLLKGRSGPGDRVRLWTVRDRLFAAAEGAVADSGGFGQADGRMISRHGDTARVQPLASETEWRRNLFVAGCDPALGILRDRWTPHHEDGGVIWLNAPTGAAMAALARGEAHVAGVHFPDEKTERAQIAKLPMEVAVIRFAQWEQGWMVRRGNPQAVRGVEDLAARGVRFLNRPTGSGSRLLFDGLLKKAGISAKDIPSYAEQGATHFDCARAIRSGSADVAVGLRAVAERSDLDFVPLQEVAFDLLVPRDLLDTPRVARLLDLLRNRTFHRQLDGLPGYDTHQTGLGITGNS